MSDENEKLGLPEGTVIHEQATVDFADCANVEIRRRMAIAGQGLVESGETRLSAVVLIGTYRCKLHAAHAPSLVGLPDGVSPEVVRAEMTSIVGRMREVADDLEGQYLSPRSVVDRYGRSIEMPAEEKP